MNERIRNILALLIKNPQIKLTEMTAALELTRRQINYAITQFNDELAAKKLPLIVRSHSGSFILPLEVLQLAAAGSEAEAQTAYYSESERAALVLLLLINHSEYVSADHVTDFLGVSKSTAAEDIKRADWLAEKYALRIGYDRINGYQLLGSDHRVAQLLSDLVKRYPAAQREQVREELADTVSEEKVMYLIHGMEQMLHLSYSDESIDYLQSALRYLINRGLQVKKESAFFVGDVTQTPEYRMLAMFVYEKQWQLPKDYLQWAALLFLTSNIFEKKTTQEYDSDETLQRLISEMVSRFETQTLIVVEDRENFERRILNHLRPACFRIKYHLSLGAYSLDSLIQDSNHAILIDLMKELVIPIENWIGKAFSNEELDLLSYYFGFQLTNHNSAAMQKPRAAVVCRNGVMVSKLMRENLKKLFPELHFLAAFSIRDFYKFGTDYNLVFTTTPLKTQLAQYVLNPIMSYQEQIHLRYRVLNDLGLNEVDHTVAELLGIIQRYTEVKEAAGLRKELQAFLIREEQDSPLEEFRVLPALTNYLKPEFVTCATQPLDWQEALKRACQPLIDAQIITNAFYNDCIRQIEEADYSGYLGTKVSIPHTTVDHGILKDGISLLVSKKPICFPGGHLIQLVVPLAFFDLTKHLRAINQLADLSTNESFLADIIATENEKEVYQKIRKLT